jgi:transposase InsO family protein
MWICDSNEKTGGEEKYVLVIIDRFMRIPKTKVLGGKNTVAVTEAINEAITPEEIITDSENESCSEIFGEMCRRRRIKHWRIRIRVA